MADKTWLGSTATIGYDSGSDEPTAGDILTGTTSGAFAKFVSATEASGSWAGNDAQGVLTLRAVSGTFQEDEVIINSTTLDTDIGEIDTAGNAFADGAGNIDVAANWSPNGVPADGDDLILNGLADTVPDDWDGSTKQIAGNKYSVELGLVQNTKDFPSIIVTSDYSGNIGYGLDGSTYHGLRCAAGEVIFAGSGEIHLIAEHTGAAEIDSFASSSSNGDVFLGKGATNGQAIGEIINSGRSTINVISASLSTLGAPEVDNVTCTSRQGSIIIAEDNTSSVLIIRVALGTVTAYCSVAEVLVAGGTFRWGLNDFSPSAARTITLLEMLQGSIIWAMAGTISESRNFVGGFTISGSGAKILGDSSKNNGTIEIFEASLDFGNASNNITLAADSEVKILGNGRFNPPPFTDIVWTN